MSRAAYKAEWAKRRLEAKSPLPTPAVVAAMHELLPFIPLEDLRFVAERVVNEVLYRAVPELCAQRDEALAEAGRARSELVGSWVAELGLVA